MYFARQYHASIGDYVSNFRMVYYLIKEQFNAEICIVLQNSLLSNIIKKKIERAHSHLIKIKVM